MEAGNLKEIVEKIDYVIDNLSKDYDIYNIFDLYRNNQIKEFNILRAQLSYGEYCELLLDIMNKLVVTIKNNDKEESEFLIELFLRIFHILKKLNIEKSKVFHNNFLDLYSLYDDKFQNGIEKEKIKIIKESIVDYLNRDINFFEIKDICRKNKLKKDYTFFAFNSDSLFTDEFNLIYEEFNIQKILLDITKLSYKLVRKNPSKIKAIYKELDRLVYFIIDNDFDESCTYKLRSLVTLKNDMMLQKFGVNEEQLEIYKEETFYFIKNNLLYARTFDYFAKSFEDLAKIHFAYWLINEDSGLLILFDRLFSNYINYTYLKPTDIESNYYQSIEVKFIISRYFTVFSNELFDSDMIRQWKKHRYESYNLIKRIVEIKKDKKDYRMVY